MECECGGTGIVVVLIETVPGGGPWLSNDGKTYAEDFQACPKCNS